MHSDDGVPSFISKLWTILNDLDARMCIAWSASGVSVIIKDQELLVKQVIPKLLTEANF